LTDQYSTADPVLATGTRLTIVAADSDDLRARCVELIREQFRSHFAAEVEDDCGRVLAFLDTKGRLVGACGVNDVPARFFSRHYVGDVAAAVEIAFGDAGPSRITELAHFCVTHPRIVCQAVPVLANLLHRGGSRYLVCTVTATLRRLFAGKHLTGKVLAPATADRLPFDLRDNWGTYYDHDPLVMAGDLDEVCAQPAISVAAS
jgi:hypothetical protein